MKNKWFKNSLILTLSAVLLLSGCGNGGEVQDEAEDVSAITEDVDTTDVDTEDDGEAVPFPDEVYSSDHEFSMDDAKESETDDSAMTIEEALADPMVPLASDPNAVSFKMPQASGTVIYTSTGNKDVTIDASNAAEGYIMVKYTGASQAKLKAIVTGPNGVKYTYNLNNKGNYETFILSSGNGTYSVGVFQNVSGNQYAVLLNQDIKVTLNNEFAPFLGPNQYVNYNGSSEVVKVAKNLVGTQTDELKKVQLIYDYVVKNITYDKQKAQTVQSGYLPNVDQIIKGKTGICFDYASVMAAMLRSQGVPAKLVTGYTGTAYHAWISAYTDETGWVEGVIFFDGNTWKLMDPTFAASSGGSEAIMKYIGDGKNYKEKFIY